MDGIRFRLWAGRVVLTLSLATLAVVFLVPFYWLLISALKSQADIFRTPPIFFPKPNWENFALLWEETKIVRTFFNSVIISGGHVTLSLFLCSLAGYGFAKFPTAPGSNKMFGFVLSTMLIPGAVTLIPVFIILAKLEWVNTYWAMIIPGAAHAYGIFWMRQYFKPNLPDDLIAAARIDGCSEFGIYWRIALPIARPALAALGLILLINSWNNLMWAFLILRTEEMQTLPLLIYLLKGETRIPFGMIMAGGLITTLPLVLAFLFFQRHFIRGITAGAIKT